jgi:hypothetical protein
MLKVKDARTDGYADFIDLPIGAVYEDVTGCINIKVDHGMAFFRNEDGVWELIEVINEKTLPLDAELVIMGRNNEQ